MEDLLEGLIQATLLQGFYSIGCSFLSHPIDAGKYICGEFGCGYQPFVVRSVQSQTILVL